MKNFIQHRIEIIKIISSIILFFISLFGSGYVSYYYIGDYLHPHWYDFPLYTTIVISIISSILLMCNYTCDYLEKK